FQAEDGIRDFHVTGVPDVCSSDLNDVMTTTHGTAAADSYAKRYLLKDIFNIAIGEDDRDGNGPVDQNWLSQQIAEINRCETQEEIGRASCRERGKNEEGDE